MEDSVLRYISIFHTRKSKNTILRYDQNAPPTNTIVEKVDGDSFST